MGDIFRRDISLNEFLNFYVLNCTREKFIQNVCVFLVLRNLEAALWRRSSKQVFLKISQYSQENNCVGVSF